jgi:hypothetical protein
MTIKTTNDAGKPETHEVNGPIVAAWSIGCLAITVLAFAAIIAVLALPIAALFRLIHG